MKIFFPIGSFYPAQSGGPNNTIYWIAKALQKNNIDVIVVTKDTGLKKEHKVKSNMWTSIDNIKVIYTKNRFHQLPFKMLRESIRQIKKTDIVFLTSIFYLPSIILASFSVFNKKKIIWSPRGELDPQALIYNKAIKKVILLYINYIKNKVVFHVTCDAERKYVKNTFGKETNLIQIPNYLALPQKKVHKKDMERYFLYIGRIHPIKAIEKLVMVWKNYEAIKSELIIAGDYNNQYGIKLKENAIKFNLENQIKFIGHIEGNKKQELLANAYFTILPSHTENFGNVVVESLAQGTPVIASKGTPWEVLEKEKAGFWIDNTEDEIAKTIDKCLSMEEGEYLEYRNNAFNLVNKRFNIESNIHAWIEKLNYIYYEKM